MSLLNKRHEVLAIRLWDPRETELPDIGPIIIEDAETGEHLYVDTHDRAFRKRFVEAMDCWDPEAADRAVTALARTAGADEISELFWRYGARDFRDIGHKAIFVANSWRTLQCIGWDYAEPVLRSLAYALQHHEGDNPAKRDGEPDRPWRRNLDRVKEVRPGWPAGKPLPQ